jgi:hypothetical protein
MVMNFFLFGSGNINFSTSDARVAGKKESEPHQDLMVACSLSNTNEATKKRHGKQPAKRATK